MTTFSPPHLATRVHTPTRSNIEQPIIESIQERITSGQPPLVESSKHRLHALESFVPHHKGEGNEDNMVYWVTQYTKSDEIVPWDTSPENKSWRTLALDSEFLEGVEAVAREKISCGNGSFYFVYGWQLENSNPHEYEARRAIMSQARSHFHSIGPHDPSYFDTEMVLQEDLLSSDMFRWQLFLNYGAEVGEREFGHRLRGFGASDFANRKHEWIQHGHINRHAYPFSKLSYLISQLVSFDMQLSDHWKKLIPTLANEHARDFMYQCQDQSQSLLRLPPRFTAAAWLPNAQDKANMNIPPDDTNFWCTPFSLVDKKALSGGYWTERTKELSK
jgi:hypothetical protein